MKTKVRFGRFFIIGIWNTVFGIFVFTSLFLTLAEQVAPWKILTISTFFSILQSYITQRKIVWKSTSPINKEIIRFFGLNLFLYLINLILLSFTVNLLHLNVLLSQVFLGLSLSLVSFIIQRKHIFHV